MLHSKSSIRSLLVRAGFCLSVLLFLFYSLIAFFNRYQTDDLSFTAKINEMGIFAALKDFFINWEANFTTVILFFSLDFFQDKNLMFLNTGVLLSNLVCFYFLLLRINNKFNLFIRRSELFILSACFILVFYSSVRAEGGVIYWSTSQIAYFVPLNFLFLGLGFWLFEYGKASLFAASIFMFLFAHSRINYDASFIALYSFFYLIYIIKYKKIRWRLQIPFLAFLFGILTYLLIPGVYKRIAFHQVSGNYVSETQTLFYYLKSCLIGVTHFYKMAVFNPGFWFVFIVSFFCGNLFSDQLANSFSIGRKLSNVMILFTGFNIALLFHVIVVLLALKTPIGYGRVFVFIEMIWLFFLLLGGLMLGSVFQQMKVSRVMIVVIFISFFAWSLKKNITLLGDARNFAKLHDNRINYLMKLKATNNSNKVELEGLKGTYVFGYEDIQPEDTVTHIIPYPNYSVQKYYQLPFMVYLKK